MAGRTADGPKDSGGGGTRAGAGSVLFCLWLLQTPLGRAWTPDSPLRDAPNKVKVGREVGGEKVISTFGH